MYTGLSGHETIGANQAIIFATAPVEILNILWTVHISQNGNSTFLVAKGLFCLRHVPGSFKNDYSK